MFPAWQIAALLLLTPALVLAEDKGKDKLEPDTMMVFVNREPPDELDRVLDDPNPKPFAVAEAIRKGEEKLKEMQALLVRVQAAKSSEAPGKPSFIKFEIPAYKRMRDTVCNKHPAEEAHISVGPADKDKLLCQAIFHSACYSLLSRRDQELIDRCPPVFYELSTKEWTVVLTNHRIDRLRAKLDEARGIQPRGQD